MANWNMPANTMQFKIAIIGRPNVGKSTLFNRLAGKRLAIVDDRPGVTRDRRNADVSWGGLEFTLIDTAGLDNADRDSLEGRMQNQTAAAIKEADLCVFVMDSRAGLTPMDKHFSALLRRGGRPVIILANKAEGRAGDVGALEAHALGFGTPILFSAEHGDGMSDLFQAIRHERDDWEANLESDEFVDDGEADRPLKIAVIGRPNAGKSTLVNQLIGESRLLTGPEAGITRDAIAVKWRWQGRDIQLVDTAGLRKKARIKDRLEKLSAGDALHTLKFAEVVILLVDASQPFENQDLKLADLIAREGRAVVIGVNKWDLVKNKQITRKKLDEMVGRLLPQIRGVPVVTLSAAQGKGLDKLIKAACEIHDVWNKRIATAKLNAWLADVSNEHPPPADKGRRVRLRYMTQPNARPPSFVAFSQRASSVPESYIRYLINALRDYFNLKGVPIRFHIRSGNNPYVDK